MLNRFIRSFTLLAVLISTTAYSAVDYVVEHQPQVLEKVTEFTAKGVLKQKPNGYLYVEVAKEYIADIVPLIDAKGKIVPPRHFSSKKGIGAHISVMYENEQIDNEIWEIAELGKEYTFTVKELRTVKLTSNNKLRKLWLLAVEAPELQKLRESYGLSSFLKGHDFHITLGTQVPGKADILPLPKIEVEEFEAAAAAA